ncbi:hypothetical protein [Gemmobacter denitrificans]|uniref:Transcriptional regulator n=1 Tax=Gemmobacter denitrificans TaxID=3123040 RepID=A0ABU8C073_9RHOB
MNGPLDNARAAWGEDMPDWVQTLAIQCGKTSQARVAKALGRSTTIVSQILNNKYPAGTAGIEERVRGVFEKAMADCPSLGPIPVNQCQDWRGKAGEFLVGNPMRVRMYRACHRCPRYKPEPEDAEG